MKKTNFYDLALTKLIAQDFEECLDDLKDSERGLTNTLSNEAFFRYADLHTNVFDSTENLRKIFDRITLKAEASAVARSNISLMTWFLDRNAVSFEELISRFKTCKSLDVLVYNTLFFEDRLQNNKLTADNVQNLLNLLDHEIENLVIDNRPLLQFACNNLCFSTENIRKFEKHFHWLDRTKFGQYDFFQICLHYNPTDEMSQDIELCRRFNKLALTESEKTELRELVSTNSEAKTKLSQILMNDLESNFTTYTELKNYLEKSSTKHVLNL